MEKELTYREAWEEIKKQIGSATYIRSDLGAPQITTMLVKNTGLFEIIDRAIKRLEFLEISDEAFTFFLGGREAGKSAVSLLILNKLKALEILNKKNINIYWLKISRNVSHYNRAVGFDQKLKKSEYDLLKGILRDDSRIVKTQAR